MQRKLFCSLFVLVVSFMLVLNVGSVQAQITGFIPVFVDEFGNQDLSVMFEDFATGNVGIGTTAPGNRLHIVATDNVYPGLTVEGNVTTFNGTGVTLLNRAGGNTNPWVLGTGGGLGPHFFQIADFFASRLVIDDRTGNVGIGTTIPSAKLDARGGSVGVHGEAATINGNGIEGVANSGPIAWGVFGSSTSGFAGHFAGRVQVTGALSKGGGSFKIDHPLDPANKYLYHSFVESPDMMNVYNGNILLDANGEAWIQLPEWFEALNRDFRYQLTSIGGFAPLYVAEEIANNRFKIAGGHPGLKVSWQVTGIRQDAWANANRIPVEEDKPASERGFYLHAKEHGQSDEKGIEWAQKPELMRQIKAAQQQ